MPGITMDAAPTGSPRRCWPGPPISTCSATSTSPGFSIPSGIVPASESSFKLCSRRHSSPATSRWSRSGETGESGSTLPGRQSMPCLIPPAPDGTMPVACCPLPADSARFLAVLLLAAGCGGSGGPAPAPRPGATASMAEGLRIADRYRVLAITERRTTQAEYWKAIAPSLSSPRLVVEEVGRSMQGRELRTVTSGTGPVSVLLWSQMHGDEPTATMALADIFAWLAAPGDDPLRDRITQALTVVMLPMLNPDGAERYQRHNAAGMDINRDARTLATPEARALKALRDRLQPAFGFNLHDQNARTRVGRNGLQAAIALLAPAADEERSYGPARSRARLVAAGIALGLAGEIPDRVARYDDAFNPRADR